MRSYISLSTHTLLFASLKLQNDHKLNAKDVFKPCENCHLRQRGPQRDNQKAEEDPDDEAQVDIHEDGGGEGDDPEEAVPNRPGEILGDLSHLPTFGRQ